MIAVALCLAACTLSSSPSASTPSRPSSTSPATTNTTEPRVGIVTGIVQACTGPTSRVPVHVTISLYRGQYLVKTDTVRSGATYRFAVKAGTYVETGWWGFKGVVARAGHVLTVNFSAACA